MVTYSAIVPNYNDGARIHESLASLAAQTHPFTDIVIVDDGSTDDSVAVIEKLIAGIPHARLVKHDVNRGVMAALNTGIGMVSTDFLFLCSANDIYDPQMVAWCDEMLVQHPQAGIVSGNVASWEEAKQRFTYAMKLPLPQQRAFYSPAELVAQHRKVGVHFNGGANALRRELVRSLNGLAPALEWHADWFLNLMCAFRGGCAYVPENLLICRLEGGKSYSSNRFDWKREGPVMRAGLELLRQYPREADLFRRSALLPKYDPRALPMLLEAGHRWFVTPLLLWRITMHSVAYRLKYVLPRPLLMAFRPLFRI